MVQVETFEEAKEVLINWLKSRGYFEVELAEHQVREPLNGGFFQINLRKPFGVIQVKLDGKVIDAFGTLTK